MDNKKILITGGAGFIGRHVVRSVARAFDEIVVLDQHASSLVFDSFPGVKCVVASTVEHDAVWECAANAQVIVHLAAGSNFLMYEKDPVGFTSAAMTGFLNVLEAAQRLGVDKVVYASTSAVYEGNPVPYTEDMTLEPPDLKALAKKVNEEMASLYHRRFGIRSVGLRPFSVYGEDEISKGAYANIVSLFAWAMVAGNRPIVWGDGSQTRDFVHVEDAAEAFFDAVIRDVQAPVLNVGSGREVSFNHVIRLINRELGANLEPVFRAVPIDVYARRLVADTATAAEQLGWHPVVSLEDGVRRVVDFARKAVVANPELATMQEASDDIATSISLDHGNGLRSGRGSC